MILTDLSNTIKKLWEKISFHKHFNDLMSDIDLKPLHTKNKLHLYSRYVLSKLSWHLTVAPLPKVYMDCREH